MMCNAHSDHIWEPVSFRFETQLLDSFGRVQVRQPDMEDARVFFICRRCNSWTYDEFTWVGYFLGRGGSLDATYEDPAGMVEADDE